MILGINVLILEDMSLFMFGFSAYNLKAVVDCVYVDGTYQANCS